MVSLEPMTEAEFGGYLEHAIADYAEEKVKAGNWLPEGALEKSAQEFHKLLPEGVASAGQHLFSVVDGETGERVGMIWFVASGSGQQPFAFIYDFRIDEAYQGRGYGKAALLALENEVRARGLGAISLHVFGHNQVARALYDKLGYEVTNLNMTKRLA